jgi:voltage-gated potassium channel
MRVPVRKAVHELLEGDPAGHRARSWVQFGLIAIIAFSTVAMIVESMPALRGEAVFQRIEAVVIAIFTVEYVLRLWSCVEERRFADGLRGRLRFSITPYALIDLAAIAPFYLAMLPLDLRFLRMLRLLRLLRLAKLVRYLSAMSLLGRVLVARRFELGVTVFFAALLLVMASAAMYYAENDAQPESFSSIPATMWWAIATLTTVGYGDMAPVTTIGRIIGGLIAVIGIGMFALPTGILGASFVDEMQKRERAAGGTCPTCGQSMASH